MLTDSDRNNSHMLYVTLLISIYVTRIIYLLIRFYFDYIFFVELEGQSWAAVTLPWFPGVHPVGDSKDL